MIGPIVVDTNVPLVAKGLSEASDDCVERCVDELLRIRQGERCVVVDTGGRILEEYAHKLSYSGQPTVGDWLVARAKVVRRDWVQPDEEHWARRAMSPNHLKMAGA